jgi:hypothetical protein
MTDDEATYMPNSCVAAGLDGFEDSGLAEVEGRETEDCGSASWVGGGDGSASVPELELPSIPKLSSTCLALACGADAAVGDCRSGLETFGAFVFEVSARAASSGFEDDAAGSCGTGDSLDAAAATAAFAVGRPGSIAGTAAL